MPIETFAGALGLDQARAPSPNPNATDIRIVEQDDDEHAAQLSRYFGEWCDAQGGVTSDDRAAARKFKLATDEYRDQWLYADPRSRIVISSVTCTAKDTGAIVASYVNIWNVIAAFYDSVAASRFIAKQEDLAKSREHASVSMTKEEQERADRAAAEARATEEENATVRASGAGGASIEDTLKVMNLVCQGDRVRGFGHRAPCLLVVHGREVSLKAVRQNVRTAERTRILNAFTQQLEPYTAYLVDIWSGDENPVSVEFSSERNADVIAQGVEHLGALCGAGR